MAKKRWSELSAGQRRGVMLSGVVQVTLLIAALVDIWRRPEEEIRGSKRLWTATSFVNFIGPSHISCSAGGDEGESETLALLPQELKPSGEPLARRQCELPRTL